MTLSDSIRNRPNFFVIGAAKAGTTRLHHLLSQHPEVFGSSRKELDFFNLATPTQEQCERYGDCFREAGAAKAIGESSISYSRCLLYPGTARRIFEFNPEARILYVVRHPTTRMESDWIEARAGDAGISRNFRKAIRRELPHILDSSLYWKQLSQYREYFPDERILLLFFEDYIQNEAATLRRCFEFLGVDPAAEIDTAIRMKRNASQGKRAASPLRTCVRNIPLLHKAWTTLPAPVKDKVGPMLLWRASQRPRWDEKTWNWAVAQLQPDAEQLLRHTGKPLGYWKWDFNPGDPN